MPDATATIAEYVAAWNCPDPKARSRMLDRCWAAGGVYVDPNVELQGAEELAAHIQRLLEARPGARIEIVGGIRVHHDVASFAWRVVLADGTEPVAGFDAVQFAADGRLHRVTGFFGGTPPWPADP